MSEKTTPVAPVQNIVHTPGPWMWRRKYSNGCEVCPDIYSESEWVASTTGAPHIFGERAVANAKLIAASPDLLKELRKAVEMLENTIEGDQPACEWWIDEVARLRAFVDSVV
jgi:hypothetical protein